MKMPTVITKAWLAQHFEHSFKWVRRHLLTDEVITSELAFDLADFKRWQTIPPLEGNRLKKWLKQKELV